MFLKRSLAEKIANRAVENVKIYGRHQGWKSTERVEAFARRNKVGVRFKGAHWLKFQNDGIRPFVMYSLEGKVIPMMNGFRTAVDVGSPGFVDIDGEEIWREQKWKHPGITAKHFIDQAVKDAFKLYENIMHDQGVFGRIVRQK